MAPLINQLLEEAVQRCTDFAHRGQAVTAEASQVAEAALSLGQTAVAEADTLHKAMATALTAIETAREEIDIETGRAAVVLSGLPARAATTEADVKGLLAGVHEDVAQLSELRARLLARVDESTTQASTEVQDLERRVHDLQQRLEDRLKEANDHVARLRQAVEEGRSHLGEEERHVREAIQSLGVMATDKAHAFAASLNAVIIILGRRVVEFCNLVVESHNGAMLSWRSHATDETPAGGAPSETWVHQALQPIDDALNELAALQQPTVQALHDAMQVIETNADHALQTLTSIASSLEHAVPTNLPTAGA